MQGIVEIPIEQEMRSSYLDYAMSVIVSRALPDVRDGLKPVHRRILYAMKDSGVTADKPYRKSARVVGEVMGKFHPHGDSAIYDAMVRLAQSWSMRVMLIDGQGNFGSVDGDSPAAMRYTEARLAKSSSWLLDDIDRNTVPFRPNYDDSEQEPEVLPAAYPNLLVNGAEGIAVGMATRIPPHNPVEVIDATLALIDNPEITLEELMLHVPAPDFPTGGIIMGRSGIRKAYATGKGSIPVRARASIEEIRKDRHAIVVTEIPYQVNKAVLQEKIGELVKEKILEGISDIRDESSRQGMRLVIELKRDATGEIVLNQLFRHTQLQSSFPVNMVALDGGTPRIFGLREVLEAFVKFREEVIQRRARFDLGKARDRGHLLIGLALAIANIDRVIAIIRNAPNPVEARTLLMAQNFPAADVQSLLELVDDENNQIIEGHVHLTEVQARGILELRLHRLTGLERDKIVGELDDIAAQIREFLLILRDREHRLSIMREELSNVRNALNYKRATEISDSLGDESDESLIEPALMVVTITREGFVKRTPLEEFRLQNRGGRGKTAAGRRGDDVIIRSFNAHTHQWVLFFTSAGQVYQMKVWRLPEASPTSKGRAMINLLPGLAENEQITAVLPLPQDEELWDDLHLVFATAGGNVRRNKLSDFSNIRSTGIIAMKLDEGDSLIGVRTCHPNEDLFLATKNGRAIRFQITDSNLRVFAGRNSTGVRGIRLDAGDRVVSLAVLPHPELKDNDERLAYLKEASARRREFSGNVDGEIDEVLEQDEDDAVSERLEALSPERFEELAPDERWLLVVTDQGFGRRSSSFDYSTKGRGGKGVQNMSLQNKARGKAVIATFPVSAGGDAMMVTDTGRLIRMPVDQVSIMSRMASGVRLFNVDEGETVISAFKVQEEDQQNDEDAPEAAPTEVSASVESVSEGEENIED
ncbi:DNA gyrase subunit A [Acetobacteraceae bacterium]|nr:DNA gyrase subunit A [Acetobacteraceae bacterium]